ncbi:MAG: acyl carrier protein [Clostridia bacterium]|nr:acyl carrier protein [Clostridia bacterium]
MIEKLENIIEQYTGTHITLNESMDLFKDIGMNSLELMEMVVNLEEEFDIEISDREALQLVTVGDVIKLLDSKK